jgi:hypothetical protein
MKGEKREQLQPGIFRARRQEARHPDERQSIIEHDLAGGWAPEPIRTIITGDGKMVGGLLTAVLACEEGALDRFTEAVSRCVA